MHVAHTEPASLDRHTLCAMTNRLDAAIGEFEDMLTKKGMWNNTLLWVTTDNGGMLPHGIINGVAGSASSNFPLRSGKASLFQGGVRAMSFVTGGLVPVHARGSTVTGLLQHVDIPATFAALAGTSIPNTEGFNVWDVVATGALSPRKEVPLNVDTSRIAKACGELAALQGSKDIGGWADFNGLIQGQWKLISGWAGIYDGYSSNDPYHIAPPNATGKSQRVDGAKVWLFDIASDPEERINLASANVNMVRSMQKRLKELADARNGYVMPQTNIPHPRGYPFLHNATWAPFLSDDEVVTTYDDDESVFV